jgi:hypothetical protein
MYNALETERDRVHSFFGVWKGMTRENIDIEKEIGDKETGRLLLTTASFFFTLTFRLL